MPFPTKEEEFLELEAQLEIFLLKTEEQPYNDLDKLLQLKHEMRQLLDNFFLTPTEEQGELLKITTFEEFLEKFSAQLQSSQTLFSKKLFKLFSCARRIMIKLNNTQLSDIAVNEIIKGKFCKVVSEFGEGTGFIIDDGELRILSSFHLVGAIEAVSITEEPAFDILFVRSILQQSGYIDDHGKLTAKARSVTNKEEFIAETSKVNKQEEFPLCIFCVTLIPDEIKVIFFQNINEINALIQKALQTDNHKLQINLDDPVGRKITGALRKSGYLDENYCIIPSSLPSNLQEIRLPETIQDFSFCGQLPNKTAKEQAKEFFIQNKENILDRLLEFFRRNTQSKRFRLLSSEVEVHVDEHVLVGNIEFPSDVESVSDVGQRILRNFAYFDVVSIKLSRFKDGRELGDTWLLNTRNDTPQLPDSYVPRVGEKIYFGGFPLTQQTYTFGTGMLAATSSSEARTAYIIEAPIAPGNSGSPVFIQREGSLFWLGVVNSEVARVNERMLLIQEKLEKLGKSEQKPGFIFGGVDLGETLEELTNTLLGNLITGKGKAFSIPSIQQLLNPGFLGDLSIEFDPFLDFLVPKRRKKPKKPNEIREQIARGIEKLRISNPSRIIERHIIKRDGEPERVYYLGQDGHGGKHTDVTLSRKFAGMRRRDVLQYFKKNHEVPATFHKAFIDNYKEKLDTVIVAFANNNGASVFFQFRESVGWDEGEETNIVQLYYGVEIGSHIRPKKEDMLPADIIELEPLEIAPTIEPMVVSRSKKLRA